MTDTVRITRADGPPELDPSTGDYVPATVTVYDGPGRLRAASSVVGAVDGQGQLLAAQAVTLSLPVATSGGVRKNDTVLIIASVRDPANVGLRLNVEGVFFQTDATARRLNVEVQL
jgi:hypothetical protein